MKFDLKLYRMFPAVLALAGALIVGIGSPAVSQEDGDDAETCTASSVSFEDGYICLHDLECENLKAKKLCFELA